MMDFLRQKRYDLLNGQSRRLRWQLILPAVMIILLIGAGSGAYIWYNDNLLPVSGSKKTQLFTVDSGSSARQIASGLQSLGLIRNTKAFIIYVDIHHYRDQLQAGTYKLSPSLPARVIAGMMARGEIDKNWLTILPGKRLYQIKQEFKQVGYTDAQLEAAFKPANYSDIPLLSSLPAGASLEGLLYPDSFQRVKTTPAGAIVRESLQEMQNHLTAGIVKGFKAQGLNTFQGLTLASIVYQESGNPTYEPTIAQVFLRRLKIGMMLGSDVTAFYASEQAGLGKTLSVDSPYNTRLHTGLPPGPIGSFTADALRAVANPSKSDYLYFVAGDNGKIHFSKTEAQFRQSIEKYCTKQCS